MKRFITTAVATVAGTLMIASTAFAVSANTRAQREAINMSSAHRICTQDGCTGVHFLFSTDDGRCTVSYVSEYFRSSPTFLLRMIVCRP